MYLQWSYKFFSQNKLHNLICSRNTFHEFLSHRIFKSLKDQDIIKLFIFTPPRISLSGTGITAWHHCLEFYYGTSSLIHNCFSIIRVNVNTMKKAKNTGKQLWPPGSLERVSGRSPQITPEELQSFTHLLASTSQF